MRELAAAMSERFQEGPDERSALMARVSSLETTVAKTLAEAEGLVIKAESLKAAARSAEERARYAAKAPVSPVRDPNGAGEEFSEEEIAEAIAAASVHGAHAAGSQPGAVPTLSSRLEGRRAITRELAARKFR